MPTVTPAEALIATVETDYSDYRREVRRLWEEHPLFEEQQTYLRNIFEMTFDGMERAGQQERFKKLRSVYPDVARLCNPTSLDGIPEGRRVFSAHSLMDYERYDNWSKNASAAYQEYRVGTITAEEFLRRIDTTHELENYDVGKVRLAETEDTPWQRLVPRSWTFDPERFFPEEMLVLNLSKPDAQWELRTADELRRRTQKGHQSLREKYGKA